VLGKINMTNSSNPTKEKLYPCLMLEVGDGVTNTIGSIEIWDTNNCASGVRMLPAWSAAHGELTVKGDVTVLGRRRYGLNPSDQKVTIEGSLLATAQKGAEDVDPIALNIDVSPLTSTPPGNPYTVLNVWGNIIVNNNAYLRAGTLTAQSITGNLECGGYGVVNISTINGNFNNINNSCIRK
jgi:hypothetical protein